MKDIALTTHTLTTQQVSDMLGIANIAEKQHGDSFVFIRDALGISAFSLTFRQPSHIDHSGSHAIIKYFCDADKLVRTGQPSFYSASA